MPGRIHSVVASLVLEGILQAAPDAIDAGEARRIVREGGEAGVPLKPYRQLLQAAYESDGGVSLLRAGRSLRGLQHPLLFVLLNSDSPRLLIEKEARLGAFLHSRHRVVIEQESEHSLTLAHVSREAAPEATEDLAACGQHITLLEEIGCQGLRCQLPASAAPQLRVYDNGSFAKPAPGGDYNYWRFEWDAYAPTRRPMPGLDELLLASAPDRQLSEADGPVAAVERIVRSDLGRSWRVSEVAAKIETSPRSLQRSLSACGETFSDLLDRIRNAEASRLLRTTDLAITEIGYICGFADSAHFGRSFKKRFELPPSSYRQTHA